MRPHVSFPVSYQAVDAVAKQRVARYYSYARISRHATAMSSGSTMMGGHISTPDWQACHHRQQPSVGYVLLYIHHYVVIPVAIPSRARARVLFDAEGGESPAVMPIRAGAALTDVVVVYHPTLEVVTALDPAPITTAVFVYS